MIAGTIEIQMLADMARLKRDMDEAKGVVGGAADKITGALRVVQGVLATIGAGALIREVVQLTDEFRSLEGRLALVEGSAQGATRRLAELTAIANGQQAPVKEITNLYLGASRSADSLGASSKDLTKFTEGVAASLRVSASNSQAAGGALAQLTQLLGGTNVQAQEFNSLVDGMPELLKVVAANLGATGISMGELRERVVKGKLSSQEFFEAFLKGSDEMIARAATLPPLVGGAITVMTNNILMAVGEVDKQIGVSGAIARGILAIANIVPQLTRPVLIMIDAFEGAAKVGAAYVAIFHGLPAVVAAFTAAKLAAAGALTTFQLAAAISGSNLAALSAAMAVATAGTGTLTTAVGGLTVAFSVLLSAFAGWEIGSWLHRNFLEAQLAGIAFVDAMMKGWEALKYGARSAWASIAAAFDASIDTMGGAIAWFLKNFAGGLSALGLDSASAKVLQWSAQITNATRSSGDLSTTLGALKADYERGTRAVSDITDAMVDDTIASFNSAKQTAATAKEVEKIKVVTDAKAEADKKAAAEAKKVDDAYVKLRTSIVDKTGAMLLEEQQGAKLTDAQKFALGVMQDIQSGTLTLTDTRKREITALLEQYLAQEELTDAQKRNAEWLAATAVANDKFSDALVKTTGDIWEQIKKQKEANDVAFLSKEAIGQLEVAKLLERAATLERNAALMDEIDWTGKTSAEYLKQADGLRKLADLKAQGIHIKSAQDSAAEWKKTTESIENGLTNSLFRAFESGKGFWSTLWDGVVNTVKTTILKPIIQDTVKDFIGWFKQGAKLVDSTVMNPTFSTSGIASWLDSFMGGLKGLLSWFSDAFSGILSWIGSGLGSIVNGIGSLFGVANTTGTIGSWLGLGNGASGGGLLGTASQASSLASLLNGGGIVGSVLGSSAAYGAALGTTSIGAGSQAAMLAAQTGQFGWAGLSATSAAASTASTAAAASSSTAAGAGAAAGMSGTAMAGLGAFGLFALGVLDVLNNDSTPRDWFGGAYRVDASGARTLGTAYNGELPGANGATAAEAAQAINALLAGLGSSQRLDFLQAAGTTGMGVYAGGKLTGGATFGEFTSNPNDPFYAPGGAYQYESNDPNSYIIGQDPWEIYDRASQFDTDPNSVAANFRLELGQAVIQALQAVSDLPASVADYLRGYDAESLSANQVAQIISQISVMQMQADARKSPSLDTSAEIKAMSQQIAYMSAKLIELGDHSKRTEENTRVTADVFLRAANGAQPILVTSGG